VHPDDMLEAALQHGSPAVGALVSYEQDSFWRSTNGGHGATRASHFACLSSGLLQAAIEDCDAALQHATGDSLILALTIRGRVKGRSKDFMVRVPCLMHGTWDLLQTPLCGLVLGCPPSVNFSRK